MAITMNYTLVILFLLSQIFSPATCSVGDRSVVYQSCLGSCIRENCLDDSNRFSNKSRIQQDIWSTILLWSCRDECCYRCMWLTVDTFHKEGYTQPKFYGKWPFTRLMGMQEPAATFSSLLNLAANAYMYRKIQREFPMKSSALAAFWHLFAFVCMNAWAWSSVFHARDKPFTEFMDYACALSMVMGLFVAAVLRVLHRRRRLAALVLAPPLLYFLSHVRYLSAGRVDYHYNMQVNVFFGVSGSVVWLAWSGQQYLSGRRHARAMLLFTALNGAALSLELLEWAPLWHAWDAHALWHLATAPLPLLFYSEMLSKLLRPGCHRSAMLLVVKGPQKINARRILGLIPPNQYDVPIPKKLHIGYVMKEYWETIPLFAVTFFALGVMVLSIIWACRNKVDVVFTSRSRCNISRTMDLRNPTVHKIIIINQRYEPWPEMADVLEKMIAAEKRALMRMQSCNLP